MNNEPEVMLNDVQIHTKISKQTKTGKDYFIFETSQGSMNCFDPNTCSKIIVSETARYDFKATDYAPGGQHKQYTIVRNGIIKVVEGAARPAAQASGPAKGPWNNDRPPYPSAGTGMNGDMARDTRISKLSIFAAIAQIQAAKIKMDPEYAKHSLAVLAIDNIDITNAVISELVYPLAAAPAAAPASAPAAAPVPVSDEPPFKQPAQPAAQPASQPASLMMPPVTPPVQTQAPVYIPPPAQVQTQPQPPAVPPVMMQTAGDKAAQAKQLFGVKTDMESAMAARVARMLGKPAPTAQ